MAGPEARVVAAPWDELADAFERLALAERHGTADDIALSLAERDRARDRLGLVAAAVLHAAVGGFGGEPSYVLPATWERFAAQIPGLTDALTGWAKARRAAAAALKRVAEVEAELDAMRCRLGEMERRLDSLTPGVGEPARLKAVG